jgi:hypothetical protein
MVQITRPIALAFFFLTGACAGAPGDRGSQEAPKPPLRGGVAEFRLTSYDGRYLKGRVLIGATVDPLVIDGEMIEDRNVELKNVRACGKTEVIGHIIVDRIGPTRQEDIVTLRKGHWHGTNAHFSFWDEVEGPGPDCFEAELVVSVLDGRVAATLPIRVVRTDKPPATPDGKEEPTPPPSGAGAP